MSKGRMEAFSDGVIAILITIMVFDLKAPPGSDYASLVSIVPAALTYLLSFVYLGIYWNNHHHMLQLTARVNGAILLANMHLLFWLSLIPFATSWLRSSDFAPLPAQLYGGVLLACGLAWWILQATIIREQGPASPLRAAVGRDGKAKLSTLGYALGVALAARWPPLAVALYAAIAAAWLVPDRRFEDGASRQA